MTLPVIYLHESLLMADYRLDSCDRGAFEHNFKVTIRGTADMNELWVDKVLCESKLLFLVTSTTIVLYVERGFRVQTHISRSCRLQLRQSLYEQNALPHASHPRSKVAPSPELGGTVNPDLAREVKDIPTTASLRPAGDRTTYPEHHLH